MSTIFLHEGRPFPSVLHVKRGEEVRRYVPERTCRVDATDKTIGLPAIVCECSACGHTFEHVFGSYQYCPRCGAKVVSENGYR